MSVVLLVEDDLQSARLVELICSVIEAVEVIHAKDGEHAIDQALQHIPDLILLDLRLPRVTGWQVASHIRQHPATAQIPIIAISAHREYSEKKSAFEVGCNAFLEKPIQVQHLRETIMSFLQS